MSYQILMWFGFILMVLGGALFITAVYREYRITATIEIYMLFSGVVSFGLGLSIIDGVRSSLWMV